MTYGFQELQNLWRFAGGPADLAPGWAAVALAESSGEPHAISPSGDYGLWQINAADWFGKTGGCGLGWGNWWQPLVNACAAVHISGGRNFAPWCTAWDNPARDCGRGFLGWPQKDSAAGKVLAALDKNAHVPAPPGGAGTPPSTGAVSAAWGNIGYFFGADARQMYARVSSVRAVAQGYWHDLIRKG